MNSDEDFQLEEFADDDDDDDGDEEDDQFVEMGMEAESSTSQERRAGEVFHYEVLSTDQIVKHMVDCIKEVNTVIQVTCSAIAYSKVVKQIIFKSFVLR